VFTLAESLGGVEAVIEHHSAGGSDQQALAEVSAWNRP
jgi:cystathionine beta-lyase/cystathionine gamma-synthase